MTTTAQEQVPIEVPEPLTGPIRLNGSEVFNEVAAALCRARQGFPEFERSKQGQSGHQKYQYTPLEDILVGVKGPLLEQGLLLDHQHDAIPGTHLVRITAVVRHAKSNQWMADSMVFPWTGNEKARGIVSTYGRRYTTLSLLGICPGGDDTESDEPPNRHANHQPANGQRNGQQQQRQPSGQQAQQQGGQQQQQQQPSKSPKQQLADRLKGHGVTPETIDVTVSWLLGRKTTWNDVKGGDVSPILNALGQQLQYGAPADNLGQHAQTMFAAENYDDLTDAGQVGQLNDMGTDREGN